MTPEQGYLEHYGVLGMKWGIRKDRTKSSSSPSKRAAKRIEKQQLKAIKKDRKQAAKKRASLSDAELDRRIDRLNRERKLKELTDSEVTPGKKFAKEVLNTSGKKVAVGVTTAAGAAAVAYVIDKNTDVDLSRVAKDAYKMATKTK